jgi:hypothetical protein
MLDERSDSVSDDHRDYGSTVVTTNYTPDELAARLEATTP